MHSRGGDGSHAPMQGTGTFRHQTAENTDLHATHALGGRILGASERNCWSHRWKSGSMDHKGRERSLVLKETWYRSFC